MTTVGIIGVGAVGAGCAMAMLLRGSCDEIVLLDKNGQRAQGAVNDLSDAALIVGIGTPRIRKGAYRDLSNVDLIVISAGVNEKDGGGVDRADPLGRLRLLPRNAEIFESLMSHIARHSKPAVPILVVTDPPDPLADVARECAVRLGQPDRLIISTGTYLDSLRFRRQLAHGLSCDPADVKAYVLGEHGKSAVYVWSAATVQGGPWLDALPNGLVQVDFQKEVEQAVRFANIDIIDGTGASQRGISVVTARIVEALLGGLPLSAEPIGWTWPDYSPTGSAPTYSLPGDVTRNAVGQSRVAVPLLATEADQLRKSAQVIATALEWARAVNELDDHAPARYEQHLSRLIG